MTNKQPCCEKFKTTIGGQALIEGIMMRGPEKDAIVVRKSRVKRFSAFDRCIKRAHRLVKRSFGRHSVMIEYIDVLKSHTFKALIKA